MSLVCSLRDIKANSWQGNLLLYSRESLVQVIAKCRPPSSQGSDHVAFARCLIPRLRTVLNT